MRNFTRRQFLEISAISGATAALWPTLEAFGQMTHGHHAPQAAPSSDFQPDLELELTAAAREFAFYQGKPTTIWSYAGRIMKGDSSRLITLPDSALGPTIRVKRGEKIRVFLKNTLPEPTIIHWHGLHVPEEMDGHPKDAISPGMTYVYEFEVKNRAGTYWYHPHPHELTAKQVYFGLAGLLIVADDEEQALPLPRGEFDLPLVIQDRTFDADGALNYFGERLAQAHSGHQAHDMHNDHGTQAQPHEMAHDGHGQHDEDPKIHGFFGDTIVINGRLNAIFPVKTAQYRLRLLNGSNARIYKIALSDQTPLTVIGTDGGLLDKPIQKPFLVLGPAERLDVLVDFSARQVGETLELRTLAYSSVAGVDAAHGGVDGVLAQFRVTEKIEDSTMLPETLSALAPVATDEAVNVSHPRRFAFDMRGMALMINGRVFEMEAVAADEIVKLNTSELWEFENVAGNMPMPHPAHVHGLQFRVVSREGSPQEFQEGYVDSGWKDTVLIMPGEKVRLFMRFEDFPGLYVYHCHILEHGDLGMMRNFRIEA